MRIQTIGIYLICLLTLLGGCKKQFSNPSEVYNETIYENGIETTARSTTYQLLEPGGSNYPMYDVQKYIDNPTNDVWFTDGSLNLVVGHYHLNATKVNNQLADMYNNGQRKIAIPIWFASFNNNGNETYGHLIQSRGGSMTVQHIANYKAVLNKIADIGYKEVIIRFAPQSRNNPKEWDTTWNETIFQENWNFENKAIKIGDSVLGARGVKHMYDLSVELGGITKGQSAKYAKKLWQNYVTVFGNKQSYGFSIANGTGRLAKMIENLRSTNNLPAEYAVDIYKNVDNALTTVANELAEANELHKPFILQECYYNNSKIFDTIMNSVVKNKLRLRFIMQWPVIDPNGVKHFAIDYCAAYNNYGRPYILFTNASCDDKNCISIAGHGYEAGKAIVRIYNPANNSLLNTYQQADLSQFRNDGRWGIQVRLKTNEEQTLFATTGVKVAVVNPGYNNAESNIVLAKK
jgi:hypothetical protein